MKNEKKRYFLVEYIGVKRIEFETSEDIERNIENVRKYNNRKTPNFIVGNMNVNFEDGKYVLYAHIYNKLTPKSTISDLDNYTSQFDEKELISDVYDKLITANEDKNIAKTSFYPDINIAYFEDKNMDERDSTIRRIKYIPVLYKEDKKYLDSNFIDNCLYQHYKNNDLEFFKELIESFKYDHSCAYELENLKKEICQSEYLGYFNTTLFYYSQLLYRKHINEKDRNGALIRMDDGNYQKSRRRQRDFGFFVKNYNSSKHKSPTSYAYLDNKSKLKEMKVLRQHILNQKKNEEKQLTLKF